MSLFDDKIKKQLSEILSQMMSNVNILYFTQEFECVTCRDVHVFLNEFVSLSEKLKLNVFDFAKDKEKADYYRVNKIPSIVILDKDDNDTRIKFYGAPAGYEINSFVQTLLEISGKKERLPDPVLNRISKINKDIHIQVFVALSCPLCPVAVGTAHRLALENKNIRADMIDAVSFTYLANKYLVTGVPKTIINEKIEITGAEPIEKLLDAIEKI